MQLHTSQSLERVHGLDASTSHPTVAATAIRACRAACGWIVHATRIWRHKRQAMQDYKRLLAMPDYILRDIGVSRHGVLGAMAEERSSWRARR